MGGKGSKPDFKELSKGSKFTTKELKDWFTKFKKDFPSGKITRQEFTALYKKMLQTEAGASVSGDATDFCDHVFRQYDTDNSGTIDFREFVTTISVAARGTANEKLLWAFNLYDIDGNHYLSPNEITEILTAIYKAKSVSNPVPSIKETVDMIYAQADDNKDGRLSEAEFVTHAMSCASLREILNTL
ncbi:hypothetical protein HELRODRAFT_185129 [Helobdella robusta]|uniref:EF-hand domain-containing protein n=1 Tax=Helobdella robusta TaxID=6412 RepID=T1FMF6_HELRO|nr:hypothetical protein HELRODRAFT_185129 [Helobdella robusta]ESN94673.1 hypothetical protein HELRODRAFT_185129 [Helobdella robusta]